VELRLVTNGFELRTTRQPNRGSARHPPLLSLDQRLLPRWQIPQRSTRAERVRIQRGEGTALTPGNEARSKDQKTQQPPPSAARSIFSHSRPPALWLLEAKGKKEDENKKKHVSSYLGPHLSGPFSSVTGRVIRVE
jgi:hypothetical protein